MHVIGTTGMTAEDDAKVDEAARDIPVMQAGNMSLGVNLLVQEVDDKTQSIIVNITGDQLDFDAIAQHIESMGGSVHSIDEVDVQGEPPAAPAE